MLLLGSGGDGHGLHNWVNSLIHGLCSKDRVVVVVEVDRVAVSVDDDLGDGLHIVEGV